MTTIEICNSYQMSITVTAIFSFIAGRYCAKGIFFLIVFFPVKKVPFLKVRLRTEDVCRYHFPQSIYSSIQYFFSRYDKIWFVLHFPPKSPLSTNLVLGSSGAYSLSKSDQTYKFDEEKNNKKTPELLWMNPIILRVWKVGRSDN